MAEEMNETEQKYVLCVYGGVYSGFYNFFPVAEFDSNGGFSVYKTLGEKYYHFLDELKWEGCEKEAQAGLVFAMSFKRFNKPHKTSGNAFKYNQLLMEERTDIWTRNLPELGIIPNYADLEGSENFYDCAEKDAYFLSESFADASELIRNRGTITDPVPANKITSVFFRTAAVARFVSSVKVSRPNYSHNEIMNMAICITQNLLTVFSGAPGCGKSSICDILGKGLKENYVSVSVGEGWSSKRDFLGYYNPLTVAWEGDEELRALLTGGTKEPGLILLDEANLSPIEYYWSDFMKACDDPEAKLNLGFKDKEKTPLPEKLPEKLRFLATINNDETTRSLSPRLIDRAHIITLPDPSGSITLGSPEGTAEVDANVWKALHQLLHVEKISEKAKAIFLSENGEMQPIFVWLKDHCTAVSPRVRIAMAKYYTAAMRYFEGNEDEKRKDALDFLISQKLLPKISGTGEEFGKALLRDGDEEKSEEKSFNKLVAELLKSEESQSIQILKKIKNRGDSLGYVYSFFY